MHDTRLHGIRVEPTTPTRREATYSPEYVGQLRAQIAAQHAEITRRAGVTDHMAGLAADAVEWIDKGRPDVAKAALGRLLMEYER